MSKKLPRRLPVPIKQIGSVALTDDPPLQATYTRKQTEALANVSTPTLKRWEKQGRITPIRVGPKLIRYSAADVRKLIGA